MSRPTIIISGNVGRDPERLITSRGDTMLTFSVAVNYQEQGAEHTEWFGCAMFGRYAEAMAPYVAKGSRVTVQGDLRPLRTYQRQDGSTAPTEATPAKHGG